MSLAFENSEFPMSMALLEDATYLRVDDLGEEHFMHLYLLVSSNRTYLVHAETGPVDAFPGSSLSVYPSNTKEPLERFEEYPVIAEVAHASGWLPSFQNAPALQARRIWKYAGVEEERLLSDQKLRNRLMSGLVRTDQKRPTLYSSNFIEHCLTLLDCSPFVPHELGLACLVADLSSALPEGPRQLFDELPSLSNSELACRLSAEMLFRISEVTSLEKRSNPAILTLESEHLFAGMRRCLTEKLDLYV